MSFNLVLSGSGFGPPLIEIYSFVEGSPYPSPTLLACVPQPSGEKIAYPVVFGYIVSKTYLSKNEELLCHWVFSFKDPSYGYVW